MILFCCIKENSQRVPHKNFRKLNDEPLYLRCLNKFSKKYKIYVDTDSNEILNNIANMNNVTVYKRYAKLIGDDISTDLLIKHFIDKFKIENETITHIFTTAPFLTLKTLNNAYYYYKENKLDSLFSSEIIQKRLWKYDKHSSLIPVNHDIFNLVQTQDLPLYLIENSIFYIFNSDKFKYHNIRLCGKTLPYNILFPENIDIDTEDDWNLCETLIKGVK